MPFCQICSAFQFSAGRVALASLTAAILLVTQAHGQTEVEAKTGDDVALVRLTLQAMG